MTTLHFVIRAPGEAAFTVPVRSGLTIGRHEDNDVVLSDAKVSRRHARIEAMGEGFVLVDAGSTHGVFLDGARVREHRLTPHDRIQIGSVLLTCESADAVAVMHVRTTAAAPLPPRSEARRGEDEGGARKLRVIYDVARAVRELSERERLVDVLLDLVLSAVDGDRALLGLGVRAGDLRTTTRARDPHGRREVVLAHALLEAVFGRAEGFLAREPFDAARARGGSGERPRALIATPIVSAGRIVGVLYVEHGSDPNRFGDAELEFLAAIANLAGAALEGADRYDDATRAAEAFARQEGPRELLGESAAMQRLRADVRRVAMASNAPVLVRGESGTGKELVARAIHARSPRSAHPFVPLNSAALPDTMIEAELFGWKRGAFTGALRDQRGKFALAHHGTLFLDEIAELGAAAQAKILRVVSDGEVQPLGAERTIRADVRVISATHKDLLTEARNGRFREDLFYRLNVVEIIVPPLRERAEDIPLLARTFLDRATRRMGRGPLELTRAAESALVAHTWPGNVRELENVLERAAIVCEGAEISIDHLGPRVFPSPVSTERETRAASPSTLGDRFADLERTERELVGEALRGAGGNLAEAARRLGISRIMMKRRAERFGLTPPEDA